VTRSFLLTLALSIPLSLALTTASCGPTCGNLTGCGTNSGSGDAGANSSSTCAALTARQSCLSSFCQQNTDVPYCQCGNGQELSASCSCITPTDADDAAYCESAAAQGIDGTNFDCSAQTGAVATQCVGVQ
jgi:hypothetical protein